jgi:hypothetical protein
MYISIGFNQSTRGGIINIGTMTGNGIITAYVNEEISEYKIIDDLTGLYIRIVKALISYDVIVINLNTQSITLNGVSAMQYLDLASRFFKIGLGTTTYTITPAISQSTIITLQTRYL